MAKRKESEKTEKITARIQNIRLYRELRELYARRLPGAGARMNASVVLDVVLALAHRVTFDPNLKVLEVDKLNEAIHRDRADMVAAVDHLLSEAGTGASVVYCREGAGTIRMLDSATGKVTEAVPAPAPVDVPAAPADVRAATARAPADEESAQGS